jgi:sirohydrochlorin ferrochelatase
MKSSGRALILFSHGSKRASWARPFEAMRDVLAMKLGEDFPGGVHLSFLEGVGPDLQETALQCATHGSTEMIVFPLFLTASTHLKEDVPTEIERMNHQGKKRGFHLIQATENSISEHIWSNTLNRVNHHNMAPSSTAVILPYYGSERFASQWETLLNTARAHLEQQGYSPILPAPVGHVVHGSPEPTTEAIITGLEAKPYAVVLPLLLSPGIFQLKVIPQAIEGVCESLRDRVRFTPDGILPDPHVEDWVLKVARQCSVTDAV